MGVAVGNIEVGKCYVTAWGEIRRVLEISGGKVTYDARGKCKALCARTNLRRFPRSPEILELHSAIVVQNRRETSGFQPNHATKFGDYHISRLDRSHPQKLGDPTTALPRRTRSSNPAVK